MPRNTLTNNSRNAILRGPILKLLKLSLHGRSKILALRAPVFKRILNSFFYTKQNTNIGRFPFDQNVRKCGNGCKWWGNFKGKSENWWISRIRTIQSKILEIPGAKLKRKKTSERKFGYTSLGCSLFRKFGKCCGRKESGHSFFFFQINSLYNACVIFQKNGTLQQYKLILLTFYWLLSFLHVIQLQLQLSNLCRYGQWSHVFLNGQPIA